MGSSRSSAFAYAAHAVLRRARVATVESAGVNIERSFGCLELREDQTKPFTHRNTAFIWECLVVLLPCFGIQTRAHKSLDKQCHTIQYVVL